MKLIGCTITILHETPNMGAISYNWSQSDPDEQIADAIELLQHYLANRKEQLVRALPSQKALEINPS